MGCAQQLTPTPPLPHPLVQDRRPLRVRPVRMELLSLPTTGMAPLLLPARRASPCRSLAGTVSLRTRVQPDMDAYMHMHVYTWG